MRLINKKGCIVCGQEKSLKEHTIIHNGQKIKICEWCAKYRIGISPDRREL